MLDIYKYIYIYMYWCVFTDFWKGFASTCRAQKVQDGGTKLVRYVGKYSNLHGVMFQTMNCISNAIRTFNVSPVTNRALITEEPQWKMLTYGTKTKDKFILLL